MKYPFTGKVQSHNKQKWFSSILEITCNLYLFTFMSCISFLIFYSFKLRYRFISILWPEALAEFLAISLRWFIAKERISWFQSGLKVEPSVRRLTSSHVSSQLVTFSPPQRLQLVKSREEKTGGGLFFSLYPASASFTLSVQSRRDCGRPLRRREVYNLKPFQLATDTIYALEQNKPPKRLFIFPLFGLLSRWLLLKELEENCSEHQFHSS